MASNSVTLQSSVTQPLNGRVAVVAGASSGIGAATAKVLAARGAKVALLARRTEKLASLVAEIQAGGGTALAITVDVTKQASVDAAAATVAKELGSVSLVVNNAGIMLPAPITEKRTADWEQMIDLNITGLMRVIGAFTPALIEAGAKGSAADLINISSIAAQNVFPTFAVYSGTKAYVSHLSRHLRTELGPKNVRVSMIEPGIVATELQSHVTDSSVKAWLEGAEKSFAFLQPADIAEAIAYLAAQPKHVNVQQLTIMPTAQV
ncbi:short-chain dehydrogenase [Opitutaceae bacterium EW11]|nr:short-chain dehydrogenase [Opitutaceae bacterium EW11]